MRRVFIIVLDSFGIGEMPDAKKYKDEGSNTIKSVSSSKFFLAPNLQKLGLFNIDGVKASVLPTNEPKGAYMRLSELSSGKDTTTGHWEIAGLISKEPFPTYKNGFPKYIIDELEEKFNRKIICNKPYSGTEVIKDYGDEHIKTGALIVYTSADSVLQIAAHEEYVPVDELYRYCEIARGVMQGKDGVGRIIARPFRGDSGNFYRTGNRHDFSLLPPKDTMLDLIKDRGLDVISVGKIYDIFAGKGITRKVKSTNNDEGMEATLKLQQEDFEGLCFVNLVDFDMLYGHRNDVDGYAKAISQFDNQLAKFMMNMKQDDMLIITADHGCDPLTPSTDHSREYIPVLFYGDKIMPTNLGTKAGFDYIAGTVLEYFNIENTRMQKSVLGEIYNV
ncbi:MAG: phosphopentomutase [Clostridiales bacterium]|nr:phosphopentomutase [Clostridiales bacterium]